MVIAKKFLLNSLGRFLIIESSTIVIIFSFLPPPTLAQSKAFYGKVVGTEFSVIQVKGNDGKVSVFCCVRN